MEADEEPDDDVDDEPEDDDELEELEELDEEDEAERRLRRIRYSLSLSRRLRSSRLLLRFLRCCCKRLSLSRLCYCNYYYLCLLLSRLSALPLLLLLRVSRPFLSSVY